MRTDSNHLSVDAEQAEKAENIKKYEGMEDFQPPLSSSSRQKSKTNTLILDTAPSAAVTAADEAICPVIQAGGGGFIRPFIFKSGLSAVEDELYQFTYQRDRGSLYMPPQISNQTSVKIMGQKGDTHPLSLVPVWKCHSPPCGITIVDTKTSQQREQEQAFYIPSLQLIRREYNDWTKPVQPSNISK
jgi:hypothetical protein